MIAILTPSRGRPVQLREMVEASIQTAEKPQELVFYVGVDKDQEGLYVNVLKDLRVNSVLRFGQRKNLVEWTNVMLDECLREFPEASIIASFGDDHRPRTDGWDTRVRSAFSDIGSGLVWTADGLQNANLPTAPFWSADVLRALGWYFPPVLEHMYADNFWKQLATDLSVSGIAGMRYLGHTLIEHMHYSVGKSEIDDSYRESTETFARDSARYARLIGGPEYTTMIANIREALADDQPSAA